MEQNAMITAIQQVAAAIGVSVSVAVDDAFITIIDTRTGNAYRANYVIGPTTVWIMAQEQEPGGAWSRPFATAGIPAWIETVLASIQDRHLEHAMQPLYQMTFHLPVSTA